MNWRALLILPPIALGVLGFQYMAAEAPTVGEAAPEPAVPVRVMALAPETVAVTSEGYGRVEAARRWTAVAEVSGRVVELYDGLDDGAVVEGGDLLLRIDPTDYEIGLSKAEANVAAAVAQIDQLQAERTNAQASLALEQRALEVAQAEYDRIAGLVERGATARANLDTAERTLIGQREAVQAVENTLALLPSRETSAEATLLVRRAEAAEARRALDNTEIRAPWRGRARAVGVERDQYVRAGDQLLELEDVAASEILAEIRPEAFGAMMILQFGALAPEALPNDVTKAVEVLRGLNIQAEVRAETLNLTGIWPASIVRFRGANDETTNTVGVVVRVDEPNVSRPQEQRPPLSNGIFVTVRFTAPPVENLLMIPRSALRDDGEGPYVYVAGDDDRLALRPLTLGPPVEERVVVLDGLAPGDRLVLSRPTPPVPGMLLNPLER